MIAFDVRVTYLDEPQTSRIVASCATWEAAEAVVRLVCVDTRGIDEVRISGWLPVIGEHPSYIGTVTF